MSICQGICGQDPEKEQSECGDGGVEAVSAGSMKEVETLNPGSVQKSSGEGSDAAEKPKT